MAACVERRAACGASYNACASGATPCKFDTRQPARPAGKATADRQFQRRVRPRQQHRRAQSEGLRQYSARTAVLRLTQLATFGSLTLTDVYIMRKQTPLFSGA